MKSLDECLKKKSMEKLSKNEGVISSTSVKRREKVDVYNINLKEVLLLVGRENEILGSELQRYIPFILIRRLCGKRILLEGRSDKNIQILGKSEVNRGWTKCKVVCSRYYSLTDRGADLANRLNPEKIQIEVYTKDSTLNSSDPIDLGDNMSAQGIGFGYSCILPNKKLEELLSV